MPRIDLPGKVPMVLGTIAPEEPGITLAQAHCLIDKHAILAENSKPVLTLV